MWKPATCGAVWWPADSQQGCQLTGPTGQLQVGVEKTMGDGVLAFLLLHIHTPA